MWDTPLRGVLKLTGTERRAFIASLVSLYDNLTNEGGEDWDTDVPRLEKLPSADRAYVILAATRPVLNGSHPPALRAWNEAAVVAVYRNLAAELRTEIETQPDDLKSVAPSHVYFRTLVQEAWMDTWHHDSYDEWGSEDGPRQSVMSQHLENWLGKVEWLEVSVVADHDCDINCPGALSYKAAEEIRERRNPDPDYFLAEAPTLTRQDYSRLDKYVQDLDREVRRAEEEHSIASALTFQRHRQLAATTPDLPATWHTALLNAIPTRSPFEVRTLDIEYQRGGYELWNGVPGGGNRGYGWSERILPSHLLLFVEGPAGMVELDIDRPFKDSIGRLTAKRRRLIRQTMPKIVSVVKEVWEYDGKEHIEILPEQLNEWIGRVRSLHS